MKVLLLMPIWIDVESMDEAADFAHLAERAAEDNVVAVFERHGYSLSDAGAMFGFSPVQIIRLPEAMEPA